MALIEQFYLVAQNYAVQTGQSIIEGMWVKQNVTTGEAVLATGVSGETAVGVSGDTKSDSTSGLPTTNPAHNADGSHSAFVNRLPDMYDETKASGKITVYQGLGGAFATDMFESDVSAADIGDPLYVSTNGKLQHTASNSAQVVAILTKKPGAYPSGVPGVDVDGDLSLGSYIEFKALI